MGWGNVIRNIFKHGLRDVNKETIDVFVEWNDIVADGLTLPATHLETYAEQVIWRKSRCPECVEADECVTCQCTMSELVVTPGAKCKQKKRWPVLMSPEVWETFKEEHGIEFQVTQNVENGKD